MFEYTMIMKCLINGTATHELHAAAAVAKSHTHTYTLADKHTHSPTTITWAIEFQSMI